MEAVTTEKEDEAARFGGNRPGKDWTKRLSSSFGQLSLNGS